MTAATACTRTKSPRLPWSELDGMQQERKERPVQAPAGCTAYRTIPPVTGTRPSASLIRANPSSTTPLDSAFHVKQLAKFNALQY